MPSFPKPGFEYSFDLNKEIKALRQYRDSKPTLKVPGSKKNNLLVATWNIANLGDQDRLVPHLKIIAEIISWFDVVAIQEIKEESNHFQDIVKLLGKKYAFIFSDAGGNRERMGFIYNSTKLGLMNEVGELSVSPADADNIKLPGVNQPFTGFDRNPYMASFRAADFEFVILNAHLYFGDDNEELSLNRRCLEAYAVGRWADLRSKSKHAYTKNVFAMGDFNLPKVDSSDPVYKALFKRGLQLPIHTSKVYSNISNDKAYDQIAFVPGMKSEILTHGVFPFDNALFADLYQSKSAALFRSYVKYFISDHRPLWIELDISGK